MDEPLPGLALFYFITKFSQEVLVSLNHRFSPLLRLCATFAAFDARPSALSTSSSSHRLELCIGNI